MKLILIFIFSLLSSQAYSESYQKDIDSFFNLLDKGKIEEAVDTIYKTNSYVTSAPDQIMNVKNQLKALEGLVGKLNIREKIDTFNVSNTFSQITYIANYDRQPVRFEFQFFKVNDGWRIYAFSFDSDLTSDINILARKQALQPKN